MIKLALRERYLITVFDKDIHFYDAYHMISNVHVTKESVKINVDIFNDSTKTHTIDSKSYTFDALLSKSAIIQDAYNLLKTLPEYERAEDVFEEGQPVE